MSIRHPSTAKNQDTEFIYQSILLLGVVGRKVFLQFAEEFSILLVLQTKPYKRRDRLAHARVDRFGVLFHLMSETGI
jgi:hypothetical protein